MKLRLNIWMSLLVLLLACGAASAQLVFSRPQVSLRGGPPISVSQSVLVQNANPGPQSASAPAVSLSWGIYTFPGSVGGLTVGITKSGHLVGGYGPNINAGLPSNHGFLLKGTKFTTLDYPGSAYTQPDAVNDAGVIVGLWDSSPTGYGHGFMLKGKTYSSIDYPGALGSRANGINKSGDIVGEWQDGTTSHGFLLSKGGIFTSIDYPGAFYTSAWGINNGGDIVGWYGASFSESHGFIYSKGIFTTFDYPGYSQNEVSDLDDSGVILGLYGEPVTINGVEYVWEHCYLYESGTFSSCDAPFGPPAVTLNWHSSSSGVVTGFYADNSSTAYGFGITIGP